MQKNKSSNKIEYTHCTLYSNKLDREFNQLFVNKHYHFISINHFIDDGFFNVRMKISILHPISQFFFTYMDLVTPTHFSCVSTYIRI